MKNSHLMIGFAVIVVIFFGLIYFSGDNAPQAQVSEEFAQCVGNSGAKMFGAYWCSHCQNQKAMFGQYWDEIEYIECSLPGGQGQTQECIAEGISSYPTWEFASGQRISGELSPQQLSQYTGCPLN